jgi:hypothetical protein
VVGGLDVVNEPEFLALQYLAEHGPAALAHTTESWHAYLDWLAWSQTPAAAIARLDGEGDRRRPQAPPLRLVTAWPGYLGADLGGTAQLPGHVCRHATDILVTGERTICRMRGHAIRVESDFGLVDRFKAAHTGDSGRAECGFQWDVSGASYFVRAQRSPGGDAPHYAFRILPLSTAAVPSLDALMAR